MTADVSAAPAPDEPWTALEPFGTAPDGREVTLVRLAAPGGIAAAIATWGATLVSLRVPDARGELDDVVLGFASLAEYGRAQPYLGATVGRYANRIAHGRFVLDGRTVQLDRNEGAHHLHGGLRGFDRQHWTIVRDDDRPARASVTFARTSPDGEAGYPGTLEVRVRYSVGDDGDALRIDHVAHTDRPTVVNLTNHAYFNLAGRGTILGHRLRVAGDRYAVVDRDLVPTGELAAVDGTPFDLREGATIGDRIAVHDDQLARGLGFDHAWVVGADGALRNVAELHDPASGRTLWVSTTQPALQVYGGNRLDGTLVDRRGAPLVRHAGVCLEAQHLPDSPNRPAFPSTVLRPGERYRHTTLLRFGARR